MKKITILLFSLLALCGTTFANDVTIGEDASLETTYLPTAINNGTGANNAYHSVSQQLYFASELTTASSNTITAITFYYTSGTSFTRKLRVWLNKTNITAFSTSSNTPNMVSPGTKVFSGDVALTAGSPYTITFDTPFEWDGTSNIVVTVFDSTCLKNNSTDYPSASIAQGQTKMFSTAVARFLHKTSSTYRDFANAGWTMNNLTAATANSSSNRCYVNKITFTFADAASAPATPTGLAVTATTHNSANLSWNTSSGATSYALKYSTDNANWSDISGATALTTNSFSWTGLTSEATYYVKVNATNANGSSDFSDAVSFTTDALHTHDGITFTKWSATDAMPTSGNYYLANNVTITSNFSTGITGALKLCLNGKTLAFTQASAHIEVGGSLEVFDHVGGGQITSAHGTSTIQVNSGASLKLHSGNITNTGGGTALNAAAHTVTYAISESDNNDALISLANGGTVDAVLERSFNSASFNTICAPFDIPSDKIASAFGSGTVIAELTAANVVDDQLELTFDDTKTSITAGKPYLIQPHNSVSNPTFLSVILKSGTTPTELPDIDFIGVVNRKTFAASEENKNLLFLQADNTLYFHDGSGAFINGMRAYFLIKNSSIRMSVNNARIKRSSETTTAIDKVAEQPAQAAKRIENGQLVIIRDGVKYNTTGQIIK